MGSIVTIFQYRLLHYRVDLFKLLKEKLDADGVELRLVHGQASPAEALRKDEGDLSWAIKVHNSFWTVKGRDICWQPSPNDIFESDLIVIMQENRLLSNYVLLLRRILFKTPVAYWGHGANFQSIAPQGLREKWKRFLLTKVDWWFAYTEATVAILLDAGFPRDKITCLNNAIDTSEFKGQISSVTETELLELKKKYNLPVDARIGLFCGSLYPEKKLELLISAADLVHRDIPEFRLIVIGDGPSGDYLRQEFQSRPWAISVGIKRGREKAALFKLSNVMLNPGLVGLHVLDAFSAGLPMITTNNALHSPEIVYLKENVTGRLTEDNPCDYADAVSGLLKNQDLYLRMSQAALRAADEYTLQNMVNNFAQGVLSFLEKRKSTM
ncbi:MAG: glycosyltransferase family 4 protein [Candidatus Thiodiazotropha endolucinida]